MATMTAEQIGMLAWNAGIHDEPTMARAVAIALAESGGKTDAHNDDASTGDNSYGLWQINMIGTMGPARRKQFDIANNDALLDPKTNSYAMMQVSNYGKKWTDWSTFNSNAYMKHIKVSQAAAKKVVTAAKAANPSSPLQHLFDIVGLAKTTAGVGVGAVTKGLDVGGAITAATNSLGASLMKIGLNVFAVIFAAILIILAIVIMLRVPMGKVATTVAGVAGPGKIAKAAGKGAKAASAAVPTSGPTLGPTNPNKIHPDGWKAHPGLRDA